MLQSYIQKVKVVIDMFGKTYYYKSSYYLQIIYVWDIMHS